MQSQLNGSLDRSLIHAVQPNHSSSLAALPFIDWSRDGAGSDNTFLMRSMRSCFWNGFERTGKKPGLSPNEASSFAGSADIRMIRKSFRMADARIASS